MSRQKQDMFVSLIILFIRVCSVVFYACFENIASVSLHVLRSGSILFFILSTPWSTCELRPVIFAGEQ